MIHFKNILSKILGRDSEDAEFRRVYKGTTSINILETFPGFVANGWGYYPIRSKLTILSVNQVIPALKVFVRARPQDIVFSEDITALYRSSLLQCEPLGKLFNKYGSDKASRHDYYMLYGALFPGAHSVEKVFEIGLGTNNTKIVSTMGENGKPGASLRAFRDNYTKALIYGADYDRDILFQDERISTFFVDQTDQSSFVELGSHIGHDFDLMIDDGLHAPNANLHSLAFFIPRLKIGGFAIVEDIDPGTSDIWSVVGGLLPDNFVSAFIQTKAAHVFVVKRLG